jgi:hypothetical protein
MYRILASLVLLLWSIAPPLAAQCEEELVLDGSEPIASFDQDSTGHWWAITTPYEDLRTLWVDGVKFGPYRVVERPVFAPDGSGWATSVVAADRTIRRLDQDGEGSVDGTGLSQISYAFAGGRPWMVLHDVTRSTITNGERAYEATGLIGRYVLDPLGTVCWYAVQRGSGSVLVRNGVDVLQADEIMLGGVWADGRPVMALRYGLQWEVRIGDQELATNLTIVRDLTVNQLGTVMACVAARPDGQVRAMMYTDEYIEPWYGPALESVMGLRLNPWEPLVAYRGIQRGIVSIYYNAADYPAGTAHGPVSFSHDGAKMVYMARDDVEFIAIDGKRYVVRNRIQTTAPVAIDPATLTIAYSTNTNMIVWRPESDEVRFARLCDRMGQTVYDRTTRSFVALGAFGQRLFRITCRP